MRNIERQKEYMKEYRKRPEVRERHKQYMIEYWQKSENKEKLREYLKEYKKRPEVIEKIKKYREEHIEEIRRKAREYNKANPDKTKKAYENFKEKHNWSKYCLERKRARVERLRAKGCTNAWSVCTRGAAPKYKEVEK